MVTKRYSPSTLSSSTVSAKGSLRTPSPSESDTPCFLMFAASFFGSKSADTERLYAHYTYISMRHGSAKVQARRHAQAARRAAREKARRKEIRLGSDPEFR